MALSMLWNGGFDGVPGLVELLAGIIVSNPDISAIKTSLPHALVSSRTGDRQKIELILRLTEYAQAIEAEMLKQCAWLTEVLERRRVLCNIVLRDLTNLEERWKMRMRSPDDYMILTRCSRDLLDISDAEPGKAILAGLEAVRESRRKDMEVKVPLRYGGLPPWSAPWEWDNQVSQAYAGIGDHVDAIGEMLQVILAKLSSVEAIAKACAESS